jgi:CHAT domain-containing protein/tetratricopeptide (TPR) repeat protein
MSPTTRADAVDAAARVADVHERCCLLSDAEIDDEAALRWLVGRISELVQSEPKSAIALAEACVVLATRIDAHEAAAGANYHWARVLASTGQPDQALHLIDTARHHYSRGGHELQALRTGLGRMHVLDDFGRHHEAVEEGEEIIRGLGLLAIDSDEAELATWLRGATLENLGVAYGFTDNHERALSCYEQAADTYRSLDMADDLARVEANRGVELVEIGHAAEGLALLQTSATQFESEGDRVWYGKCLGHQAAAHMALGNYMSALSLLEQARRCLDDLGAETERTRLTALLAEVSIALSLHEEAFDLAQSAATVFRKAGMTHDLALALRWSGVACMHTSRVDQAISLFEEAQSLFTHVGAAGRAAETALAIAASLNRAGRIELARTQTDTAFAMLADGDSDAARVLALMHLADLSEEPAARNHLEAATAIADELRLPPLSWPLHLRLGRSFRRTNNLERATCHLQTAVDIIERLQGTVPDEALRAVFLGDKSEAFDELADLLLSLPVPDIDGAFAVRERARCRVLVEAGANACSTQAGSNHDSDERIARHGRELAGVYNALMRVDGTGSRRRKALNDRAAELERHITVLRMQRVGSVDRADRSPVKPASFRASNDGSAKTVLTYEILGDTIHAFVLRGDDLSHCMLPTGLAAVSAEIDELDRQWTHFQFGSRFASRNRAVMTTTTQAVLDSLYRHLLAPVEALLGPATTDSSISVVSSGPLHRVPFNALGGDHHERRAFTMAPRVSVGSMRSSTSPVGTAVRRPLVMGVSDETTPCATNEAQCVSSRLRNPLLYLDDDATIARLREHAPTASIVHLACHGLHRADNPLFSSLRLADGWISALDVLDLALHDTTVVLSACDSGRQRSRGAEPLGLSWAFLGAGAAAVLVSLWTVQDNVASHLMSAFYDHLNAGADHAHALRSAQNETATAWPHPYYWAGFVLVGPAVESSHRRLS